MSTTNAVTGDLICSKSSEAYRDNYDSIFRKDKPKAQPECLPCPFCGKAVDLDDGDTLYPNGTGWKDDKYTGLRSYHRYTEVPRGQWCYSFHCTESSGGCSACVTGDTKEEALAKWNARM